VRVDSPRATAVERSVRVAWAGGERRLRVGGPAELLLGEDDLSPFVPIALLLAMRRQEPLEIDGPVSERLLAALPETQEILSAWSPTLHRVPVRARELAPVPARPAAGRATCFSRGVDATYSATRPRPPGRELTHLVYCEGFDPSYTPASRDARLAAAHAAAERIGLPLVVATTNMPELIDHVVDFEDAYGAALAMAGLALGGGLGTLGIPSSRGYAGLLPAGSHPLLDPRWSTERTAIEHDGLFERVDKVIWLVDNRPDLLAGLHVCYAVDSAENCGRCLKCLNTALLLEIAGGLDRCPSLGPELDLEAVARDVRFTSALARLGINSNYNRLDSGPRHDELRRVLETILSESSAAPHDPSPHGILRHQNRLLTASLEGRFHPPLASGPRFPEATVGPLPVAAPAVAPEVAPRPRRLARLLRRRGR